VVKSTFEMISNEDLPGPLKRAGPACPQGAEGRLRQADQARVRQHQGVGPLRHHPHAAAAQEPDRGGGQAVRPGGQALHCGVLSAGRVHGHHPHDHRRRPPLPDQRQGAGQPRLAGGLRQGGAGRRRQPGAGAAGRAGGNEAHRRQRAEDPPAGALHRGHAAVGHGRRGQADRRRRTARRHGREGPGHAGHARGHHRRPDRRKVHVARRSRAVPHGQGLPADDACCAAWRSKT
jgi:hypothetical protein